MAQPMGHLIAPPQGTRLTSALQFRLGYARFCPYYSSYEGFRKRAD